MDSPEIDLSGIEVLCVDDDPAFREFVATGLQKNRARSRCFAAGDSVLAALREGPIEESDCESRAAVVLLDIMMPRVMMPRVEGWDVLTSIRQDHPILPVILVTARESVEERVRGLRMGADDYVIKPFVFVELLARIESVCRRRTAMLHCRDLRLRGQGYGLAPHPDEGPGS